MSSKTKLLQDGRFQLLRYCSWATSAGFADFYTVEVTSPNFDGNYMNESVFLMYKVCITLLHSRVMPRLHNTVVFEITGEKGAVVEVTRGRGDVAGL